jgi:hypothetical protein
MADNPIVIALPFGAVGPGVVTLVIDNLTYRVAQVDAGGRLLVALDDVGGSPLSANANYGAAQTDTVVVAAPGAGLHIYVASIAFSTAIAGNFYLHENTSGGVHQFGPHYFDVNSGISHPGRRPPIKFADNKPVRITTNIAGNHTIDLGYYIAG